MEIHRPVVSFLIPFASQKVKSDWGTACDQLKQTLESIRGSLSPNYTVVVIGHEQPDFNVELDSRFKFISLNHDVNTGSDPVIAGRSDVIKKLDIGFKYAVENWNPLYVMRCDADDLISNKLVDWLENAPSAPGFLINRGWVWDQSKYFIQYSETHDRICGTCLVIRSDYADKEGPFLTDVDGITLTEEQRIFVQENQNSIVPGAKNGLLLLNNAHQRYTAYFKYLGVEIKRVPFEAVIYRICNRDSLSKFDKNKGRKYTVRQYIGKLRRMRLITNKLKKEFSIL